MKTTDIRPEMLRPYDPRFVPLPAPIEGVLDAPTVRVCINSSWVSHLDGMLERLLYRDAWTGLDEDIERAIDQVQLLLSTLSNVVEGCDSNPSRCTDFPMDAYLIDIQPADPFTEPDDVPDGYAGPPFTAVKDTDGLLLLLGYQVGDIITDLTRFPTGSLPTVIPPDGFARFRVTFDTPAEVEIHLLKFAFGGRVTIQEDNNPLTARVLDLNFDSSALPAESELSVVVERIFEDEGSHWIDVTFIPSINDEVPFLFYGGGCRKITICREGEIMPFDVRQNEETPCILEKTEDGFTWLPFADLQLCPPRLRRFGSLVQVTTDGTTWTDIPEGDYTPGWDDPAPGPRPEPGPGQDQCCLAAANAENAIYLTYAALSPEWPIVPGLEAILGADIANLLRTLIGPLYDAFEFGAKLLASFVGGVVFDIGTYTETIREDLRTLICEHTTVIANVATVDYDAVLSEALGEVDGVWGGIAAILGMVGPAGLDLAAATTAIEEADCGDCGCTVEWCVNMDFADGNQYNWDTEGTATWDGSGFLNTYSVSGYWRARIVNFFTLSPGSRVTSITMYFEDLGARNVGYTNEVGIFAADGQTPDGEEIVDTLITSGFLTSGATTLDWDGDARGYAAVDGEVANSVKLTRITVGGTGDIPTEWEGYPTTC